ncbi:MAG: protein kinase [Deltaproteobacteria bacterium]|nr:protein kinase [Deltaproteobacteria bacterium]
MPRTKRHRSTLPPTQEPVSKESSQDQGLKPGLVVGDVFRILYVLGAGSMGTVYLAEDLSLKRKVALKLLAWQYQSEPDLVERFQREAVAMAKIRHQNVVQIYSFGTYETQPYFVMEYVDGESLADLIDRRKAASEWTHIDEAIGIMTQVCRGVQAIHDEGIIHRDLKPANILLSQEYRVAVADFGLVRPAAPVRARTLEIDGTPMYLAPERVRSANVPTEHAHLCDIYSLGAILFELLIGVPPFDKDNVADVLDAHLNQPPPSAAEHRSDLPKAVDKVIARAMAKEPANRYPTCNEIIDDLLTIHPRSWSAQFSHIDHPLRVVVVDGDAILAAKTARSVSLAYQDSTVMTAMDGKMALQLIDETDADVVIADEDTPGLDALELCTILADRPDDKRVALIVMMNKPNPLHLRLFKDVGAADVIEKSTAPARILEVLRGVLEQHDADPL